MDKKALRRAIRAQKEALTMDQIELASAKLAEMLYATEEYQQAKSLYIYLSYNQEVRTKSIIERAWADGKLVAVPKIVDGEMRFIHLRSFDEVGEGYKGIPEPIYNGPVAQDERALVLLPGLAFDREGRRIGYGGGYYDRYLAAHRGHTTIALCYDFQLFDRLETEEYDIPAQMVLSAATRS